MLGLNNNSFHRGEEIIYTFRPRFLIHSKMIFLKLIGIIILIYSFGFLVNVMYSIQSAAINIVHLPIVQYSIYFIIFIVFIVILWVICDLIKWYNQKYILTNQRIISQSGLIRKKKSSIIYDKIEDITIFQNLSSRLVSAGTIHIYGGHDAMHVVLEDVPNPDDIEEEINNLMSASWKRNRTNPRSNNSKRYNHKDDFDYIDRTTSSKPNTVNTFDDNYDKRYGYENNSNYYDEEHYPRTSRYDVNYRHRNLDYEDVLYNNREDYKNQDFKHNKSEKLSFDDPKFWEDDYSDEQTSNSYSKKYKESRETLNKNRKKAMNRHSERFKQN